MLWADIPIKGEEPLDRNVESWDNLIRRITVYSDVIRAQGKQIYFIKSPPNFRNGLQNDFLKLKNIQLTF